jgi:hypothetical protein
MRWADRGSHLGIGKEYCLLQNPSRPHLGPTKITIQLVLFFFAGDKAAGA